MSGTKSHRGWGWMRKRPSGRFQVSFIGSDRNRHFGPTTFSNRMRAERWLANERDLIERAAENDQNGEHWDSPAARAAKAAVVRETLSEFGSRWIAQRDLKPRTRTNCQKSILKRLAAS